MRQLELFKEKDLEQRKSFSGLLEKVTLLKKQTGEIYNLDFILNTGKRTFVLLDTEYKIPEVNKLYEVAHTGDKHLVKLRSLCRSKQKNLFDMSLLIDTSPFYLQADSYRR